MPTYRSPLRRRAARPSWASGTGGRGATSGSASKSRVRGSPRRWRCATDPAHQGSEGGRRPARAPAPPDPPKRCRCDHHPQLAPPRDDTPARSRANASLGDGLPPGQRPHCVLQKRHLRRPAARTSRAARRDSSEGEGRRVTPYLLPERTPTFRGGAPVLGADDRRDSKRGFLVTGTIERPSTP